MRLALLALALAGGGGSCWSLAGLVTGPCATSSTSVAAKPDPRWVFYSNDKTYYASPWFGGRHRIMIPFGCTRAPYYSPDPRCSATSTASTTASTLRCRAARGCSPPAGRPSCPASLGPAYGTTPLLLRAEKWDLVIGHVRSSS